MSVITVDNRRRHTSKRNNSNQLQAEEEKIGSRKMELMNGVQQQMLTVIIAYSGHYFTIIIFIGVLNDQHLACGAIRISTTNMERDGT